MYFPNSPKFILCQEDAYLLELVRYIHLNQIRAQLIDNMEALDHYLYSGKGTKQGSGTQFILFFCCASAWGKHVRSFKEGGAIAGVSLSVKRGERTAHEAGFCLVDA